MKNFRLFLENKELEQLFSQEIIEGNVTITNRISNIKTKRINGTLTIKTKDYGDLQHIQVDEIHINNTGITELINLPQTLKKLNCWSNQIISLDNLPQTLEYLDCRSNRITSLDNLPQGLEILDCTNNKITKLDNLPKTLESLSCAYNKITKLDNLPQTLESLICGWNKISNLDNLPSSLKTLYCLKNKITKFENLPNLVKINYCQTPIHNLVEKYDKDGIDINLAQLIQALKLDSTIHTEADIHPFLDILKPEDYKQCSELLESLNINLNNHSSDEILNILKDLA